MPSYDFTCEDCGGTYEIRVSMAAYAAGDGRTCPDCASENVERAFTAVNVIAGSRSGGGFGRGLPGGDCGPGGFT